MNEFGGGGLHEKACPSLVSVGGILGTAFLLWKRKLLPIIRVVKAFSGFLLSEFAFWLSKPSR